MVMEPATEGYVLIVVAPTLEDISKEFVAGGAAFVIVGLESEELVAEKALIIAVEPACKELGAEEAVFIVVPPPYKELAADEAVLIIVKTEIKAFVPEGGAVLDLAEPNMRLRGTVLVEVEPAGTTLVAIEAMYVDVWLLRSVLVEEDTAFLAVETPTSKELVADL